MESKTGRRIAIVTDSTADIPRSLVEQFGINVIPQILIMGDKTWRDGVDIDSATFYELLRTSPNFPASSQPSVVSFQELFTRLAGEAEGIAAILISNELSGTLNSARMAAANLPDVPIELVDSRSVSMQLGFVVLAAARAAAAGGDLSTVVEAARAIMGKAGVYFTVDTLEYLHRGGRIGAATKLFGTALSLKPLLCVRDGLVQPVAKVRTRHKALDTLLQVLGEQWAGSARVHAAVLHVAAPDDAAELAARVKAEFQPVEIMSYECGPVIGCHAGPGTVGVAYYVE
jgi:DegV family protein with EDD domain